MNYMMKLLILFLIISAAIFPTLVRSRHVKCDQLSGKCINGGEKEIMRMKLDLDVSRRILKASRYISYDALKNDVPAKQSGQPDRRDNPYRRGCNVPSNCFRFTD